ncbi:MAG TPA: UrcA family protein [Steroidobacteraceae bacterium]|nr:UrcA family protein [Steroidobacteraceae bacterium]
MNTSPQLPRILAVTIFAALTCGTATVSFASDGTDALQATVKYGDLNVSSPSGAATLYGRIRAAAENVCHPFNNRDLASKKLLAACVHKAMSDAVIEVNQPALFTIYNAKSGTSKPIMLASGQAR